MKSIVCVWVPNGQRKLRAGQKHVLVIDDNPEQRRITREIVRENGYAFAEASNGEEGLAYILAHKPDLVLLDYMMPGMNGAEVLQELVRNPKYKPVSDTPVIMLTAKMRHDVNKTHLFQLGLQMYLEKPFASHELSNVIENVFALHELRYRNHELEQRIKRTEYKYQDLIENASDLIFTLNSRAEFVFINRRLSVLTGFLREAWKDRSILDMVIPEDRHLLEVNFNNTLKGRSRIFEMRIRAQSGKIIFLSTNINPMFEHGEVVGCVGIARDVTQRKKLEQQITELKNFNESIVQGIASGLMTIDLDNRITSFNRAAEEVLGWTVDQVIGKDLEDIFPPDEVKQILPEHFDVLKELIPVQYEMEMSRKDGKKIHVGYTVTIRNDNRNQHAGLIVSFRDISQIKQMQAEVLRMVRLASLGVLASGIAHEIRNPLAGIKTVAQTLEEDLLPSDGKREYVARIIRQVNRMDELLRTLFSYARPQSPVRCYCKLQDIIHEVNGLMQKRLDKSQIDFKERYDPELPAIYVDPHQIQQVFMNLFLNAIDAMPQGGEISVTAHQTPHKPQHADRRNKLPVEVQHTNYVEIHVRDSGTGISKDDIHGIFDPFFTTKAQGTGLGLSIVYRIVEEHRGEIKVASEPGNGTQFTLLLPMNQ